MKEVFIAILSALLTSFFTAIFLKSNDNKNREADIANIRRALAKALYAEISTLIEIYYTQDVELDEWNFLEFCPPGGKLKSANLSQNYVVVYESNLDKLGIFEEEDIPYIVKWYVFIKALIDFRIQLEDKCKMYLQDANNSNSDTKVLPLSRTILIW